jgi:transcriptional regulator with XRE-family HTH domain
MVIGDRLRTLREGKKLSQGDIEKRTGLLRCYISRVKNCHTVPSINTLEKLARALNVPMYQLFHEGEHPKLSNLPKRQTEDPEWVAVGRDRKTLDKFRKVLSRADDRSMKLLMFMAQKMAQPARFRAKA